MHVTRAGSAPTYQAVAHHGVVACRLQGRDASPVTEFWVGLSDFAPGGGADRAASPSAKVYIVVEGTLTVMTASETVELGPLDSCLIEANEERTVLNRGSGHARMLVISPS